MGGLQTSEIFGVFDSSTDDLGESGKELGTRRREPIAADESAVISKRLLDTIVGRTARAMDVFPIPPAPMSAMGLRSSARLTTFSISSSHPKNDLGGGGGNSPRGILRQRKTLDHITFILLTWVDPIE